MKDRRTYVPRGTQHHGARLTNHDVRSIRRRASGGESQRALAKEYGVGRSTVSDIVCGRSWTHLS